MARLGVRLFQRSMSQAFGLAHRVPLLGDFLARYPAAVMGLGAALFPMPFAGRIDGR